MIRKSVTFFIHFSKVRIKHQSPEEIYQTLFPTRREWNLYLTRRYLRMDFEGVQMAEIGPINLTRLYGTLVTDDNIYIVCNNQIIFLFDRKGREMEILFPEASTYSTQSLLWRCGLVWNHIKHFFNVISKSQIR